MRPMRCEVCGCTSDDCSGCVERTGDACSWVAAGLCSACVPLIDEVLRAIRSARPNGSLVPHRVLLTRDLDADGWLARKMARARRDGLVLSSGRGRNRCHSITPAGKRRASA